MKKPALVDIEDGPTTLSVRLAPQRLDGQPVGHLKFPLIRAIDNRVCFPPSIAVRAVKEC